MPRHLCSALFFLSICTVSYGQTVYTFTNCGATGAAGPTQTQVNNTYTGGNSLTGQVTASAGIQQWTVPTTGTYRIAAYGAQGGGIGSSTTDRGGLGAKMEGDFILNAGEVLHILVGQMGTSNNYVASNWSASGGGATFVVRSPYSVSNDILLAAGGGGGRAPNNNANKDAVTGNNGNNGGPTPGNGGTNGNGGSPSPNTYAGGGAGFLGNGIDGTRPGGGIAFVNGGAGGVFVCSTAITCPGGFGGGGGSDHRQCTGSNNGAAGGGGGGYSGGGGAGAGGGGGSYFNPSGSNPSNAAGFRMGHGLVTITFNSCAPPTNLSYTLNTVSYCTGTPIAINSPTFTGDPATSYAINPALPSGLIFNTSTGVISGTPNAASAAANYTVTVTNGCGNTTTNINITVNALPTVSLNPFTTLCTTDGTLTLTGGSPTGGTYFVDGSAAVSFDPSASGTGNFTITYEYTDGNNCSSVASQIIQVVNCTGISYINSRSAIKLFPNPVENILYLNLNEPGNYSATIFDGIGKQLANYSWTVNNTITNFNINTSMFGNGVYHLYIRSETGSNWNLKFIIAKR